MMLKKTLVASAIMLAAVSGAKAAGSSVTLGVTGTITPGACSISVDNGGTFSYGSMSQGSVETATQLGQFYYLGRVSANLSISCAAPTKVEIAAVDNKAGQVIDSGNIFYGLADGSGTTSIGEYSVLFNSAPTVDNTTAAGELVAPTGTTSWATTGPGGVEAFYFAPGYAMGVIKSTSSTVPDSFTTLTGVIATDLRVSQAYVNTATSAITLNGSATLTLQYL